MTRLSRLRDSVLFFRRLDDVAAGVLNDQALFFSEYNLADSSHMCHRKLMGM